MDQVGNRRVERQARDAVGGGPEGCGVGLRSNKQPKARVGVDGFVWGLGPVLDQLSKWN